MPKEEPKGIEQRTVFELDDCSPLEDSKVRQMAYGILYPYFKNNGYRDIYRVLDEQMRDIPLDFRLRSGISHNNEMADINDIDFISEALRLSKRLKVLRQEYDVGRICRQLDPDEEQRALGEGTYIWAFGHNPVLVIDITDKDRYAYRSQRFSLFMKKEVVFEHTSDLRARPATLTAGFKSPDSVDGMLLSKLYHAVVDKYISEGNATVIDQVGH
jgi:hypothetical protein